ncbi:HU family DNA-binding protein [Carboxylicivirga sp. RSCT41]|uniref:HU family DNA-binding protein n=1 Tax=Carboxylicivirga agarovorans TaxID=3417570 RepID=UPI003D34255A
MKVKFKVQERTNPQNRDEKKYYVQPIRVGTIQRTQLETEIIELTSLSKSDVRGVLVTLSDLIARYISMGYNVSLDDVGTLSLRTTSEGSDKPEDVTAFNVKSVSVGFRAAPVLREGIEKIKFEKE